MLTRLVTLALAFGPGGLLGFALPPGRYRWAAWASAPILTLGLISVGVVWLPTLHLPNGAVAVLVTEVVLAAAAIAVARLLAAHRGDTRPADPERPPWPSRLRTSARRSLPRPADLVALAGPALVCLAFGHAVLGRFRYPTGWDAMNHGALTGNIIQTGSTAMTAACSTGSTVRVVACQFYPVAADVAFAQSSILSGGPVSVAMTTWSLVIGPLALVGALYAVVRVMGATRVAAACVAGIPAVLGPLWAQQLAGRITGGIPAFGVTVALLLVLAVKGRHPIRLGLLAGLAGAGLLMTHTYDVLFATTLALALLATFPGRVRLRAALTTLGTAALTAVVTVLPVMGALFGAGGERAAKPLLFAGHYGTALRYWVTDLRRYELFGQPVPGSVNPLPGLTAVHIALWFTVPCLLAAPFCFAFPRLRWGRPWVITWAAWTVIGIWTTVSTSSLATAVSGLWYGQPVRVRDMIFVVYTVLAVLGACVIGSALQQVFARLTTARPRLARLGSPAIVSVVTLALVLPVVGLGAVPSSSVKLRGQLARLTPRGAAYPRVYDWLAQNMPPGDVVAYNRNSEFMPWVFADHRVGTLLAVAALDPSARPNDTARWLAWQWLVGVPGVPPQGCQVRTFRIAYVAVGAQHVPGTYAKQYRHPRIAVSPNVELVHRDHGLRVFRVTDAGRACPAPA